MLLIFSTALLANAPQPDGALQPAGYSEAQSHLIDRELSARAQLNQPTLTQELARAVLGDDNGLSASTESGKFKSFTSALRDSPQLRPRVIFSRGCSESTALMDHTEEMLALHGISPANGANNYCHGCNSTRKTSWMPYEILKPLKNPVYAEMERSNGTQRGKPVSMDAAILVLAARAVASDNLALLIKGMPGDNGEILSGQIHGRSEVTEQTGEMFLSNETLTRLGAYTASTYRENFLDELICRARDCLAPWYLATPLNATTGQRSTICLARRTHADQPIVRINTTALLGELHAAKARSHGLVTSTAEHVASRAEHAVPSPTFAAGQLLAFERSDSEEALGVSLTAWKGLMAALGVPPAEFKLSEVLGLLRKSQGSHPPAMHDEALANLPEVRAVLKGTEFEWQLRSVDE